MKKTLRSPLHLPPILIFSSIIFFICLGDGIMSYLTPVYVGSVLKNSLLFGVVISSASFFGMTFDFFVAKNFVNKNYKFFVTVMIIFALLFPIVLSIAPANFAILLGAMLIWAIYYELSDFSKFNFINSTLDKSKHVSAWSLLVLFQAGAYLLGPIAAIFALEKLGSNPIPFYIAILAYAPSILMFMILNVSLRRTKQFTATQLAADSSQTINKSIIKELAILRILGKKIWPIFLFAATIQTIDAAFWSIGVLLSEHFRSQSNVGGLFIVVYSLAGVIMSAVAGKIFKPYGKKYVAFLIGIAAGITSIFIGISTNIYIILIGATLISAFYSAAVILISAVFEDYVSRLGTFSNDMVSISLITNNVAYLFGPIILGGIAQLVGLQPVYTYLGIYIVVVSIAALIIVPKKVRLPQKELNMVESRQ